MENISNNRIGMDGVQQLERIHRFYVGPIMCGCRPKDPVYGLMVGGAYAMTHGGIVVVCSNLPYCSAAVCDVNGGWKLGN
jgi:hypothetical protein